MKNLCSGTHRGWFQFSLILDPWDAVVVFGRGKNLLFKYILGHCVNGFNLFAYLILLYLVKQRQLHVWRIWYWTLNFHSQYDQNAQVDLAFYGRPKLNDLYLRRNPYHNLFISCEMPKQNKKTGKQDYKQIEVKKVMFDCSWVYIWHCMSY